MFLPSDSDKNFICSSDQKNERKRCAISSDSSRGSLKYCTCCSGLSCHRWSYQWTARNVSDLAFVSETDMLRSWFNCRPICAVATIFLPVQLCQRLTNLALLTHANAYEVVCSISISEFVVRPYFERCRIIYVMCFMKCMHKTLNESLLWYL